jgi:hypothetical protein
MGENENFCKNFRKNENFTAKTKIFHKIFCEDGNFLRKPFGEQKFFVKKQQFLLNEISLSLFCLFSLFA